MGDVTSSLIGAGTTVCGVLLGAWTTYSATRREERKQAAGTRAFVIAAVDDLFNLTRLTATHDHYYPKEAIQRSIDELARRVSTVKTSAEMSPQEYAVISEIVSMAYVRLYSLRDFEFTDDRKDRLKCASAQGLTSQLLELYKTVYETLAEAKPVFPFNPTGAARCFQGDPGSL